MDLAEIDDKPSPATFFDPPRPPPMPDREPPGASREPDVREREATYRVPVVGDVQVRFSLADGRNVDVSRYRSAVVELVWDATGAPGGEHELFVESRRCERAKDDCTVGKVARGPTPVLRVDLTPDDLRRHGDALPRAVGVIRGTYGEGTATFRVSLFETDRPPEGYTTFGDGGGGAARRPQGALAAIPAESLPETATSPPPRSPAAWPAIAPPEGHDVGVALLPGAGAIAPGTTRTPGTIHAAMVAARFFTTAVS